MIECVCSGEGREFNAEITAYPENLELMLSALEAFKYRHEGNVSKLMEHYTDDDEALALIEQAEAIYRTITTECNNKTLADIDALSELMKKSNFK